ncbi:MAG: class I SAM-dependent methyltransferase [Anaerolineales bacterium]|uniref:class I SAM-dependent methyltransferase n=1 Tax=Candidatus Villigracilis affinis TaxID=3140682 RepID=UPI001D309F79|nr:class I SAM-dependent methyltransferase [Anaerolineales bacterium]MBK9601136.1 class I SAM-dependent methyltransferase [Anaerolineales bacterium]
MKPLKDPEGFEKKTLHKFVDFANARVLEIGCGEGRLTWKYAAASTLTVGMDPDQNALRIARADSPYDLREKVRFTRATARHLPFSKETFDIAVLAWSL